tara:strand:- start:197 stop:778 length:582 start_codon:yes stop_codon:yes gene_type:complete
MGVISRAGDLVYTFRFLKLLVTPFEKTNAFKLGLIDDAGKKLRKAETTQEKSAYNPFHRIVFNIKKLIAKVPGGKSTLASYASALYLIKEEWGLTTGQLKTILKESGVDRMDLLAEQSEWYMMEGKQLSPGVYRLTTDKVLSETWDDVVRAKDRVRICEDTFPVGNVFGLDIYEAVHVKTNRKVHVTVGELLR